MTIDTEMKTTSAPIQDALKVLSDTGTQMTIAGRGLRFDTVDLTGDRFLKTTEFFLQEFKRDIPVLMSHGQDEVFGKAPIGAVVGVEQDELGLWVTATLTAAEKYLAAIRKVLPKLGWSSGALPQLVSRKSAENGIRDITSWYISEWSLTPTPAEPMLWQGISEIREKSADLVLIEAAFAQLAVEFPPPEIEQACGDFARIDAQILVDDCDVATRDATEGENIQRENALDALRQRAFRV